MRRVVCALALLAAGPIFAAPAAAQTETGWFLNTGVGSSFGTFGSTPVVDVATGYRFNEVFALGGEFGVLPHAPFEKAAGVAPAVSDPNPIARARDANVTGYHASANLTMTPGSWSRMTPYVTGGIGTFSASTVATFDVGALSTRRHETDTHFATNVGAGLGYRINRWLGVHADYRRFIVDAGTTQHVNRFTTGISVFVK
jgi:outer membrane beta-barrel protein